jgi:hypothetical protein
VRRQVEHVGDCGNRHRIGRVADVYETVNDLDRQRSVDFRRLADLAQDAAHQLIGRHSDHTARVDGAASG